MSTLATPNFCMITNPYTSTSLPVCQYNLCYKASVLHVLVFLAGRELTLTPVGSLSRGRRFRRALHVLIIAQKVKALQNLLRVQVVAHVSWGRGGRRRHLPPHHLRQEEEVWARAAGVTDMFWLSVWTLVNSRWWGPRWSCSVPRCRRHRLHRWTQRRLSRWTWRLPAPWRSPTSLLYCGSNPQTHRETRADINHHASVSVTQSTASLLLTNNIEFSCYLVIASRGEKKVGDNK